MSEDNSGQRCQTVFIEQVMPSMVNHYGTLFGGIALQWMDKAAWVVSTRLARHTMVTVASDKIVFKEPVPQGSMVELRACIEKIGRTSVTVMVEMHREDPLTGRRKLATTGRFVMVALDESGRPAAIEQQHDLK